jgi:hypothetical protein
MSQPLHNFPDLKNRLEHNSAEERTGAAPLNFWMVLFKLEFFYQAMYYKFIP